MSTRTRLWDKDFKLLYDSGTDVRTVEQFLAHDDLRVKEVHFTKDDEDGNRKGGRVMRSPKDGLLWYESQEYLRFLVTPSSPWWDQILPGDDRQPSPDLLVIEKGSRVGFEKDGKVFVGLVKDIWSDPDSGGKWIEMEE